MRFSFVLLLCFLVGCAFGAGNYLGCKTGVSPIDVSLDYGVIGFPSNPVGNCQTACFTLNPATISVGLGSQKLGTTTRYGCYCDPTTALTPSLPVANCPLKCPGTGPGGFATSTQGTHCGSVDANNVNAVSSDLSVYVIACNIYSSVCDDPHFTGLDGSRYDYMANPNRVVALISDRAVQVNGLFVQKGNTTKTYMGQVGIRVCNRTMRFFPNGTVVLGEGEGVLSSKISATTALSEAFTVTRLMRNVVRIQAGSWRMTIDMNGRINIMAISHLESNDTNVHGAFGITGHPDHRQHKKELCQPGNEGGCELPGKWQDYELPVGTDLCSTEWTYKQFNTIQCPLIVQHAVEVQKLEDKRRGVSQ